MINTVLCSFLCAGWRVLLMGGSVSLAKKTNYFFWYKRTDSANLQDGVHIICSGRYRDDFQKTENEDGYDFRRCIVGSDWAFPALCFGFD